MKRNIIIALILICVPISFLFAQTNAKKFTGTITYKITYPANAVNPIVATLPTTLDMQVSANKARIEMALPFGKNTFIMNGDELTIYRLVEMETGKYFVKRTKEDFNKGNVTPMIMPLKEAKKIAGQNCKSSEVNMVSSGKTTKSKIFYSEELGNNNIYFNTSVRSVPGIMLEFEYNIMGIPVQLTAISVEPGRVSNKLFEIPAGYTETSEAKLREMARPTKK